MYAILRQNTEIWERFTSEEEYSPKQLDKHDRFLHSYSSSTNVLEPEVSKYLIENGLDVKYPEGKKFAVCLTHDIDDIYPPLNHTFLASVSSAKKLDYKNLVKQISWKIRDKKQSPYINFNHIMELEDKYNAKSSFYFIAAKEDIRRFRYDIEDIETELGNISDNGWEVGLHGGYYSYDNLDEIVKEKKRVENVLGNKIIGFRNHYLRFKAPDSWELLSKAGFKYDTTFGYSDMVGFRNGMCHPFKPFNRNESREIDILEIPLVIMDVALFDVGSTFQERWEYAKALIDTVEVYNGVITFLWHNNVFNCPYKAEWSKFYEKVLEYCYQKDAWITNGSEIWKWWSNEYL